MTDILFVISDCFIITIAIFMVMIIPHHISDNYKLYIKYYRDYDTPRFVYAVKIFLWTLLLIVGVVAMLFSIIDITI